MTLQEAIEEVKRMSMRSGGVVVLDDIRLYLSEEAIATILNAVVKGDLK